MIFHSYGKLPEGKSRTFARDWLREFLTVLANLAKGVTGVTHPARLLWPSSKNLLVIMAIPPPLKGKTMNEFIYHHVS